MQRRSTEAPVVYALHGWEVRAYEQVVSTMDFAHELVAGRRSAIVVARSQTAGRGSHGRQWLSQIGGLYLSWAFPGAEEPETLLAVFAVAAIDVLVLHGCLVAASRDRTPSTWEARRSPGSWQSPGTAGASWASR